LLLRSSCKKEPATQINNYRQSFVDVGYLIGIRLLLRHPGESRGPEVLSPGFRLSLDFLPLDPLDFIELLKRLPFGSRIVELLGRLPEGVGQEVSF